MTPAALIVLSITGTQPVCRWLVAGLVTASFGKLYGPSVLVTATAPTFIVGSTAFICAEYCANRVP